ncbi:MAG: acetyl-CoA carboxylase, carboxyltransferase subunit beta [bacterium]
MSILDWFAKQEKKQAKANKLNIPGNLWIKCKKCGESIFTKDLELNNHVCPHCNYHFRVTPEQRIKQICDANSFKELYTNIEATDTLNFQDTEPYKIRLKKAQKKTKNIEAVIVGEAKIKGNAINIGVLNFGFLGGSMGSVVGEKLTRLIELACKNKNSLIIFSSSGGARMQEGILSLMQMAKTSAALNKLSEEHVPYISILCDPTTGGTSASFAMLGDIHIAEPEALISFAGPRVIEQTIKEKLPKEFQKSEFLLKHGQIDMIIHRKELRDTLSELISILNPHQQKS